MDTTKKVLSRVLLESADHRIVCTRYLAGGTVRSSTTESRTDRMVRTLDQPASAAEALRWARTELRALAAGYRRLELTPGVIRALRARGVLA